jgi:SAM-dependent methyltransferase
MDRRVYEQMQAVEDDHWWFRGRRSVIAAVLKGVAPATGPVLDAGCGSGGNGAVYTRIGPVIGVDTEPAALLSAQQRGYRGVGVASLAGLPVPGGTFALVCATDVVEHVADDLGALRELRRVTRPGGHLLVTVPAYRWLWSDSDVQLGHFRRYTGGEITARCREAGWLPERTSYFNSTLLPAIAAVRYARRRRGRPMAATELEQTGPVANRVLRWPMLAEARLVGAGGRLPAGVSIVTLSRNRD